MNATVESIANEWNKNKPKIFNGVKFDTTILLEYFDVYTKKSYFAQCIVYERIK